MFQGLKSIIGLLIAAGAAPYLTQLTGLSALEQAQLAAGGVGAVGIGLRLVTKSPVAIGLRKYVARGFMSQRQADFLVTKTIHELALRQKAARELKEAP